MIASSLSGRSVVKSAAYRAFSRVANTAMRSGYNKATDGGENLIGMFVFVK